MAIRKIRGAGAADLYKKAAKVPAINAGVLRLLDDMIETMRFSQGLGLAAPQLGIAKCIVVVEFEGKLYELINPVLLSQEGETIDIEGCLSYPGVWAEVSRPHKVTIQGMNRSGKEYCLTAQGILARALCHELDHLRGILFIDRVERVLTADELEEQSG